MDGLSSDLDKTKLCTRSVEDRTSFDIDLDIYQLSFDYIPQWIVFSVR